MRQVQVMVENIEAILDRGDKIELRPRHVTLQGN